MAETAILIGTAIAGAAASAAPYVVPAVSLLGGLASAGLTMSSSRQQAAAARVTAQSQQQQAAGFAAEAQQLRLAAGANDIAARQEELRGVEAGTALRRELIRTLAAQNARYAAAGLAIEEGTPAALADATAAEADRQTRIVTDDAALAASRARVGAGTLRSNATFTDMRADSQLAQAATTRTNASAALRAAPIAAGVGIFDSVARFADRLPGEPETPAQRAQRRVPVR